MSNKLKSIFDFDAGKIIAKLHLGACQTHENMMFFNSGIINNENITPDTCNDSNINFDFKNKNGLYEIGIIIKEDTVYSVPQTLTSIYDIGNIDNGNTNGNDGETDNIDTVFNTLTSIDEDPDADEHESELVQQNIAAKNNFLKKQKTIALKYLKDYMSVFAGKAKAEKIEIDDIVMIQLSEKFSDPYNIKKYPKFIIPAITDDELKKLEVKNKKDFIKNLKTKKVVLKNLCFKIAYELKVNKK